MPISVAITAYLALFFAVGAAFLLGPMVIGRFIRPNNPNKEKLDVYECGEPAIGSSYVQFDLRFYVVALLFIIFDVEIAFFFPWATVFGKATHLMDNDLAIAHAVPVAMSTLDPAGDSDASPQAATPQGYVVELTQDAGMLMRELGVPTSLPSEPMSAAEATKKAAADSTEIRDSASTLALITICDIGAFFAVLMVGFAYVWKRGDLDWVRAVTPHDKRQADGSLPGTALPGTALPDKGAATENVLSV